MPDVWLAPYLPMPGEAKVGPWRFIPFRDFGEDHARDQDTHEKAQKLADAYRLDRPDSGRFGSIVVPEDGQVGDEAARELIRPLRQAVFIGLIDANPSFLLDKDEEPNAGHAMSTSENSMVFGHPLTDLDGYVLGEGSIVQSLDLRTPMPGEPFPPITPPVGLPTPVMSAGLDEEYATAVYEVLTAGDARSRQLDRCIQWYVIALSNTDMVDADTRVVSFRAAFEVLLGGGARTRKAGEALSTLLADSSDRKPRTWHAHGGERTGDLDDTEWWFQSFALLRNAIMHGDAIADDQWAFPDTGKQHWKHADDHLRRAIKRVVITAGHDPDLELSLRDRDRRRAYRAAEAKIRGGDATTSR